VFDVLLRRITFVAGSLALTGLLSLALNGCSASNHQGDASKLQRGMAIVQSFSFGDSGALYRPGAKPQVSFDSLPAEMKDSIDLDALPSGCPKRLPVYPNADFLLGSYVAGEGSVCIGAWRTNDSTDEILAHFKEAFARTPWSVGAVQPTKEDGSAWLQFQGPGILEGLVGIGPVEDSNGIALWVWFDDTPSSQ
jgi:hypothetical protein